MVQIIFFQMIFSMSLQFHALFSGDQMVNHIPNCNLLTNKLGLLNSLQDYNRSCATVQRRTLNLDFIPETYRLDDLKDRESFVEQYKGLNVNEDATPDS